MNIQAVYGSAEYFSRADAHSEKSKVDYLRPSMLQNIASQISRWRKDEEAAVVAQYEAQFTAPISHPDISDEYFGSFEPFFQTINLYKACLDGWNRDGSLTPTSEQLNAALLGVANLMVLTVPAPAPMLLDDGTIGGYWRLGQRYASIDFETDGNHTWAGTDGQHFKSGTWSVSSSSIPESLLSTLKEIDS